MKTPLRDHNQNSSSQWYYLTSFQRKLLEKQLKDNDLSQQYKKRIWIMLLADHGKSQTEICKIVDCCQSTARHWILVAQSGQAHHWKNSPIGRPKAVNEEYLKRLEHLVKNSPKDFGYPFRRWTAGWLSQHLAKELGIKISNRHLNRLLKEMGLSTRSDQSQEIENKSKTDFGIAIKDLQSEAANSELTTFNSAAYSHQKDSNIYGSQSIHFLTHASGFHSSFWEFSIDSRIRALLDRI
ncbi:MAG: winged helix-turn-helix domain-containing protein [Halothece sp. Uz-M2-17]|nr:winged helix-turn-helix domain-containing protein [Halothece sp. Uz-M2-17]